MSQLPDTTCSVSIRAFAIQQAAMFGGIHGDPGLILDAARQFEEFMISGSKRDELRSSRCLAPILEPEARIPTVEGQPESATQSDRSFLTPYGCFAAPSDGEGGDSVKESLPEPPK